MAIAHGLRDEGAWLRKRTLGSPYAIKVGEDEHAAYIAGFAGDCVSEFINSKNTD